MSRLYAQNYRPLVRLAALLVGDPAAAETIVQDAFVDLHCAWPGRSGPGAALAQLRRAVIERSRSVPPATATAAPSVRNPRPSWPRCAGCPPGSARCLVLHYFADLTEAQIAAATGIGPATVRSHIALAFSLLRAELLPVMA